MNTKAMAVTPGIPWNRLALALGLIGLGVLIPQLGLPQAVTGPLVNALLILTVDTVGIGPAVLVGLTTPLNALVHGVLRFLDHRAPPAIRGGLRICTLARGVVE